MPPSETRTTWMDPAEEAGLMKRARRRERAAYAALVRHYLPPIHRLAFALTRNRADADALAKTSFLHGWKGIAHAPDSQRVFPWLARIVRNLAIGLSRRRGGKAAATPEPTAEASELFEAVALLEPDDQMALALRLVERLSYPEIEAVLQGQPGLALARLARVRDRLLRRDDSDGEERAA